jgi:hypothetical protein
VKEREICATFAILLQTTKVMSTGSDKGLVKMEKVGCFPNKEPKKMEVTLNYRIQYDLRFQASKEGLGIYSLQRRRDCHIQKVSSNRKTCIYQLSYDTFGKSI